MSSVVISGNTSGTVTLDAPAVAGTTVLTLPATSGTVVTTATTTGISGSAITTGTVGVSVGGTGRATNVAYSVVCGGTTTGGAEQSVASVGTSGQVLTSGGAGALPTWTTISSSPTTAQVLSAYAGAAFGDVGSYVQGVYYTGSYPAYVGGATIPASQVVQTTSTSSQGLSGTWRVMQTGGGGGYTGLFLRIS